MSNETKHTPRSWQVDALHGVVKTDKGEWVICGEGDWVGTISEANARLIAAAPELLEALHTAMELLEDFRFVLDKDREESLREYLPVLQAAIQKAEGNNV